MFIDRWGKVCTLLGSLALVSSCDRIGEDDPNLMMTFSCHGQTKTKMYLSGGSSEITTQPVSHSVSFWRTENDELERMRSLSRYKTGKYSIDDRVVNLTPSNKDVQVDTETVGYFRSYEDHPKQKLPNGRSINERHTVEFNFVTRSLNIKKIRLEWNEKERTGQVHEDTQDTTRCELVSDQNVLKEMSVIRWSQS